jgi:hypothetical protein
MIFPTYEHPIDPKVKQAYLRGFEAGKRAAEEEMRKATKRLGGREAFPSSTTTNNH